MFIDQNYKMNQNYIFSNKISINYLYLPCNTFFENSQTFMNATGFIKRTTKIIIEKNTKSNWQILRKLIKYFKNKLFFLTSVKIITFNFKKIYNFQSFNGFQFYPSVTLTSLNFYLTFKNKTIKLNKFNFKLKEIKIISSKLKYWLDDFYNGGRDQYSLNSTVINKGSKLLRLNNTNFF